MKHRIALPIKATILKIIKTVDSTTTVVLFLDSSCSCKTANTSPLVSPGSMLFMAQTQEAKNLSLCRQPTAYFLQKKKIRERMHLIYRWRKLSGISVLFYLKGINCSQLSLTYVLKQQIIFLSMKVAVTIIFCYKMKDVCSAWSSTEAHIPVFKYHFTWMGLSFSVTANGRALSAVNIHCRWKLFLEVTEATKETIFTQCFSFRKW